MPYSIGLSVSDVIALETPIINITRVGNVPLKEQGIHYLSYLID
jgi:hypothetical protein